MRLVSLLSSSVGVGCVWYVALKGLDDLESLPCNYHDLLPPINTDVTLTAGVRMCSDCSLCQLTVSYELLVGIVVHPC